MFSEVLANMKYEYGDRVAFFFHCSLTNGYAIKLVYEIKIEKYNINFVYLFTNYNNNILC